MKYVKICLLLISLLLVEISTTFAQQDKKDKIEALKIAFITKRLDLTPKEAQLFWPVYNQYNDQFETMRKDRRKQYAGILDRIDSLPNKEVEALLEGEMAYKQKELDLTKEYHNELKKVLPLKKIAKLYVAEEAFKRELLRRIQEMKK